MLFYSRGVAPCLVSVMPLASCSFLQILHRDNCRHGLATTKWNTSAGLGLSVRPCLLKIGMRLRRPSRTQRLLWRTKNVFEPEPDSDPEPDGNLVDEPFQFAPPVEKIGLSLEFSGLSSR